jgi:4-hydroxy-2-oxoglutarate aldolase
LANKEDDLMGKSISLSGCYPPIATPFDEQGAVALDRLAANLEQWQKTPLAGFAVLGSNGEFVMLNEQEKVDVWKVAREVIRKPRLLLAGTGCESTRGTMKLNDEAARIGADAALVVTPHYYKARMDHRALVQFYTQTAEASAIPIVLYNVPAFTGVDISVETIVELAQHPNIVGLKESSGNVIKMGGVAGRAPRDFQILAGSGSFLLPAMAVGAVGGIMAVAAIAAHDLAELVEAFERGDLQKAKEIQIRLIPANAAVTSRFGIPGLKAAMDMTGMYGGPVRPPLLPLPEEDKKTLREILVAAGLLA